MVRPRLVQEGAPIYGPGSDAPVTTINDDEAMGMSHADNQSSTTQAPTSSLQRKSSLQQAASRNKNLRKATSTSCVIGGAVEEPRPTRSSSWRAERSSSTNSFEIGPSSGGYVVPSSGGTLTITPQNAASSVSPSMSSRPTYQHTTQAHYQIAAPMDHEIAVDDSGPQQDVNHYRNPQQQQHSTFQQQQQQQQQHFYQQQPQAHNQYEIGNFSNAPHYTPAAPPLRPTQPTVQTSHVIGGGQVMAPPPPPSSSITSEPPQKMEGVEDLSDKSPLVVLDGANVAYAYADAMQSTTSSSLGRASTKPEPDAVGIQVATDYFQKAGLRVLVVLPQYWFRTKPRPGDHSSNNASMETPQLEVLRDLKAQGLIVASPPADDDDAYALTISRREESRSLRQRDGQGPGFVLSNDMFRDAQQRDPSLRDWLTIGRNETIGPGRISYTFCEMGTMNTHGERILDFVPNPRHPLVVWTESIHHRS